jgi:hypothetical protein
MAKDDNSEEAIEIAWRQSEAPLGCNLKIPNTPEVNPTAEISDVGSNDTDDIHEESLRSTRSSN